MEILRLKRIELVELDILALRFQGAGMETVPPIGIDLSQSPHLEARQRLERHLLRRAGHGQRERSAARPASAAIQPPSMLWPMMTPGF
jgi:hypothetical protein